MDRLKNIETKKITSSLIKYVPVVFFALFTFLLYRMIYNGSSHHRSLIYSNMKRDLSTIKPKIKTIYEEDAQHKYHLRDYYILSSYNSCCQGKYKQGFVSLDALELVLSRGARFLDFEVYQIDNHPHVAVSTKHNVHFKTSYNSIPTQDVLNHIRDYAFNASKVPNSNDPLFIHFRIKSNIRDCSETLSGHIKSSLSRYLLSHNTKDIYEIPLKDLLKKIIIMVHDENSVWKSTTLNELVDIKTGSQQYQFQTGYDIDNLHNPQNFIKHNQQMMSLSVPNDSSDGKNISFKKSQHYGVQWICMNFGSFDTNLQLCLEYFNQKRTAFVLKPKEYRYIPEKINAPSVPNIDMTHKHINLPYFKSTI